MKENNMIGMTILEGKNQICSCGNGGCDCDCEICPYAVEYRLEMKVKKVRKRRRVLHLECTQNLTFVIPRREDAGFDWKVGKSLQVSPAILPGEYAGVRHLLCKGNTGKKGEHLYIRPCQEVDADTVLVVVEAERLMTACKPIPEELEGKYLWHEIVFSTAAGEQDCGDNTFELWAFKYDPEVEEKLRALRAEDEQVETEWNQFVENFRIERAAVLAAAE